MNETATLAIGDALRAIEGSLRMDRDQKLITPRISLEGATREQNAQKMVVKGVVPQDGAQAEDRVTR